MSTDPAVPSLVIGPATNAAQRRACAEIMAASDPWLTLGIGLDRALSTMSLPDRELFVATSGGEVAAFALISVQGVLSGYLQTIGVAEAHRGRGIGACLLAHVEERVFREKPNVFLFVSSFNAGARRFYAAHGYEEIGEVKDFLVAGHGEWLMRKTRGPLLTWAPPPRA